MYFLIILLFQGTTFFRDFLIFIVVSLFHSPGQIHVQSWWKNDKYFDMVMQSFIFKGFILRSVSTLFVSIWLSKTVLTCIPDNFLNMVDIFILVLVYVVSVLVQYFDKRSRICNYTLDVWCMGSCQNTIWRGIEEKLL